MVRVHGADRASVWFYRKQIQSRGDNEAVYSQFFFSLSVNLGALARYLIVPAYSCVMIVHSLVHLVRGDLITCKTNLFVFREIYKLKKEIRKARAKINRARTDWWVLSRVLRLPPFSYVLRAVRNNA